MFVYMLYVMLMLAGYGSLRIIIKTLWGKLQSGLHWKLAWHPRLKVPQHNSPDKHVISPRASMAPASTVSRLYRMAIMAAMKKVLSPSSDTMMTEMEATKAWMNPRSPLLGSSSFTTGTNGGTLVFFCKEWSVWKITSQINGWVDSKEIHWGFVRVAEHEIF